MKKWFNGPKFLFTLLMLASILAIVCGVYLGIALGTAMPGKTRILPFLGIVCWVEAWIEFLAMCLRLRRGESAFTAATGRALGIIGWCMAGLAAVTVVTAIIGGTREASFLLIEAIILPCFFLAVAVVAKILRGLLNHAMALEAEQEGVV